MSLWAVLVTGLLAGGASCAAVQGGLLAGAVARRHQPEPVAATAPRKGRQPRRPVPLPRSSALEDAVPVGSFLAAKLVSHTTTLTVSTDDVIGCTRVFTIPSTGQQKYLPETGDTVIDLGTLKPGDIRFSCAMGMYSGSIEVHA